MCPTYVSVFYILWLHGHNDPSDEETGAQKLEAFAGLHLDSVVLGWSILAGYYTCGIAVALPSDGTGQTQTILE